MTVRGVDDRIAWFLGNKPAAAGRCAEHVWHALGGPTDPPRQGLANASAVARLVMQDRHMQQGAVPRGAIRYWVGGSSGDGHVSLEYADLDSPAMVASTDVGGPRTVGVREFEWFARTWPRLTYVGWSWYWGAHNTEPKETVVPADPYIMRKVETDQTIKLNTWTMLDLGKVDRIQPPVGSNDWDAYLNLDLTRLKGATRNDLRYVLGRWARHDASSPDAIAGGIDVTGADTKAISADLPKATWRGTWSHGFKGEKGVPVSFWVYVGSVKDGSVVSPLRIFKVDDET